MNIRKEIKKNTGAFLKENLSKTVFAFFVRISFLLFFILANYALNLIFLDPRSFGFSIITVYIGLGLFVLQILVTLPIKTGIKNWFFLYVDSDKKNNMFKFYDPKLYFSALWLNIKNAAKLLLLFCVINLPLAAFLYYDYFYLKIEPGLLKDIVYIITAFYLFASLIAVYVFSLRYFLCPYLLWGFNFKTTTEVIKASKKCMKGNKLGLLALYVSMIPSYISWLFVIPAAYTYPYVNTVKSIYARYLYHKGD